MMCKVRGQRSKVKGSFPRGFALLETVAALTLVAAIVIVFGSSLSVSSYAQMSRSRNIASALADEELAALINVGAGNIPVQTNGSVLGVLFTQGTWAAAADGTAPSSPNVLAATTSSTSSGITELMPLPNNAYDNFTLSAKMKALTGAPAGWKMGLVFRASDLRNLYQVYLTSTNLKVEKIVSGTNTELYSDARSISTNSWQTLQVVTSGNSIAISLNGILVTTVTDASFSSGEAALAGWGGASVNFDDVTIAGATEAFTTTTIGDIPNSWRRFGLSSLRNGAATLTAASLFGDASFKQVTVTITWNDAAGAKSLSRTTFIRN